jgi:hypothetical protein
MAGTILDDSELIKQLGTRSFYQPGGPGTPRYFFGINSEYNFIDGAEIPTNGSIDPIYVPDPRRPDKYRLVSRTLSAPDLPTLSLVFLESWGGIPRVLLAPTCSFNMYEVHGRCADLSDFYRGWESYMLIYSQFKLQGTVDLGTRMARDSDDPLQDSVDAAGVAIYPVGAVSFGDEATTNVVVEVIDIIYGRAVNCGNCGALNDGTQMIYALTRANVGSPSAPGQLVYSLDGGATWANSSITGIGLTAEPAYIDISGNVLFVGTNATTLFWTTLNADTGAPTTWNSVTLPVAMTDVYVQSAGAIYFSASAGRIYRTTDITIAPTLLDGNGTDNFSRIHGANETIVAVGANGRVYRSVNNGQTWSTLTAPAATTLNALFVLGAKDLWVGGADGNVYHTVNAGASWTTAGLPQTGGTVQDIQFATREVAWVAYAKTSVAYLITSLDGGNSWADNNGAPGRIVSWPVFARANRLAFPTAADIGIAANYLAVAGLTTSLVDGVLLSGAPTIL